jgi:hypothetical protein
MNYVSLSKGNAIFTIRITKKFGKYSNLKPYLFSIFQQYFMLNGKDIKRGKTFFLPLIAL